MIVVTLERQGRETIPALHIKVKHREKMFIQGHPPGVDI